MTINVITNNTQNTLQLWDIGTALVSLAPGQSVNNLPITIISVSLGGVSYMNKIGGFVNNDSYSATFVAANPPNPAGVLFTGNTGTVFFS